MKMKGAGAPAGRGNASPSARSGIRAIACRVLPWLLMAAVAVSLPALLLGPAHSEVVIAVTPTRIPVRLYAGETQSAEVTLINQGTEEAQLRPRVMLVQEEAEGELLIEQDERCAWITCEDEKLTLMPAQEGDFAFSIGVPAGTAPGLHHLALTFELARDDGEGIGLTGGVAVLVDLEVLAAEGGGDDGFPLALTISLIVLASLLAGLLVVAAAVAYRGGSAAESTASPGGKGDGRYED